MKENTNTMPDMEMPTGNNDPMEALKGKIKGDIDAKKEEEAKKNKGVKGAKISDQKDAVIVELLKPSVSIKDGKQVEIPVTMGDFFKRLNKNNFCVPISKTLLISAFGDEQGANTYADLRKRSEILVYVALKYHNAKMKAKMTKKELNGLKNDVFTALKDVLNRIGYEQNKDYKLNAHTADTLGERAFNVVYRNRADITNGYTAKTVSAMGFMNFTLKLIQVKDADFTNIQNQALNTVEKSMRK